MSHSTAVIACALHLLAMIDAARAGAAQSPDPFASCQARLAEKPDDYESASCFSRLALDEALWPEGRRVFEALIASHPDNFWLRLAYGSAWAARAIASCVSRWRSRPGCRAR